MQAALKTGDEVQAQSLEEAGSGTRPRLLKGRLEILRRPAQDPYPSFTAFFVNGQEANIATIKKLTSKAELALLEAFSNDCHDAQGKFCETGAGGSAKGPYDKHMAVFDAAEAYAGDTGRDSRVRDPFEHFPRMERAADQIATGRKGLIPNDVPTQAAMDAALLLAAIPQSPQAGKTLYRGTEPTEGLQSGREPKVGDILELPLASVSPDYRTAAHPTYNRGAIYEFPPNTPWIHTEGIAGIDEGIVSGKFKVTSTTLSPEEDAATVYHLEPAGDYRQNAEKTLKENNWDFGPDLSLQASAAATAPTAAGLAVVAQDTGRVLMLQRALSDNDPAGGKWEFPGGTLDSNETPQEAATREWSEETGAQLPTGQHTGSWTSPNGVYQGFVYTIKQESDLPINLDHEDRQTLNPDDPDGDQIETVAWWAPEDLKDNPALRDEAHSTDWDALTAAAAPLNLSLFNSFFEFYNHAHDELGRFTEAGMSQFEPGSTEASIGMLLDSYIKPNRYGETPKTIEEAKAFINVLREKSLGSEAGQKYVHAIDKALPVWVKQTEKAQRPEKAYQEAVQNPTTPKQLFSKAYASQVKARQTELAENQIISKDYTETHPEYTVKGELSINGPWLYDTKTGEALTQGKVAYLARKWTQENEAKAEKILANSDVYTRIEPSSLTHLLQDGRMRTFHEEAGQENSISNHEGGATPEQRRRMEEDYFGKGTYPVYGYLSDDPHGFLDLKNSHPLASVEGTLGFYGDIAIKLRPEVKQRTTYTLGDSAALYGGDQPVVVPQPVLHPSSLAGAHYADLHKATTIRQAALHNLGKVSYFESQIHGGVKLSDIDVIQFTYKPPPEIQALLKAQGVKWTSLSNADNEGYSAEEYGLTAAAQLPLPTDLRTLEAFVSAVALEFPEDDIRYVIGEQPTQQAFNNDCHDEAGRFCETGGTEAPKSEKAANHPLVGDLSHLSPANQEIVHAQIKKIPEDVQRILTKKGVTVVSKDKVTRSQSGKGLDYGGVYNPTTHQVEVSNRGFEDLDIHNRQGDANFVLHEFGHALDYALGRVSQHPAFKALWKDAAPKPGSYFQKPFGGTNPREELLAEAYANVWQKTEPRDFTLTPSLRQIATELRHNINTGEEFAAGRNLLDIFASILEFANPNHDEKGRFTEAGGGSAETSLPSLSPEQYKLLQPVPFNRMLKADTESQIMQTPNGAAFVQAIDDWASAEKTTALRSNITKEINNPGSGNDKARAVLGALRGAATDNQPLYRGMAVSLSHNALAQKYKEGSTIDMNLSSFSTNHEVANGFAQPTNDTKETKVMLALTGTHKAVPIQNLTSTRTAYKELEHVTGGRFTVTSISQQQLGGSGPEGKFTVIQLHQVNTL